MGVLLKSCVISYMHSEERVWILISRAVSADITPAEMDELELILIQQPQLRADFEAIKRLGLSSGTTSITERRALERRLEQLEETLNLEREPAEAPVLTLFAGQKSKRNTSWIAAAALISLICMAALAWNYWHRQPQKQQVLTAAYGKRIHTILPDGSKVWLNAGSTINYTANFGISGKREILLKGEAFFDVKHDAEHPFIVHTGKLNVVVLGTAFNVKAYPGDSVMETTLIRGKVVILNDIKPDTKIVLLPHEKVTIKTDNELAVTSNQGTASVKSAPVFTYDKQAIVPENADDAIDETSWVNNKLVFKKENFAELAQHLERWYNVAIVFDNDKYVNKQFTGTFTDQDINEAMHALQMIGGFHYIITNSNQVHIY